jgi:hypothetical protein
MNKILIIILFFLMTAKCFAASPVDPTDPCASGLLAWINRPSPTGSPCVIPNKKMVIEGGYQYLRLPAGAYGYVTPQTELRFGLPHNNEFLILTPSFYHQTISPRAGWSGVTLSVKHEIGYNTRWLGAVEGLLTLPSGSDNYGTKALAGTVNGILMYTFDPVFSLTGMLGVMSQSVQYIQNGERFTSINPDIVASWQLNQRWLIFAELYAQTRTGAREGAGLLTDGGIFYLPTPRISLDAELGQRISGQWGFQNYAGVGFGLAFG